MFKISGMVCDQNLVFWILKHIATLLCSVVFLYFCYAMSLLRFFFVGIWILVFCNDSCRRWHWNAQQWPHHQRIFLWHEKICQWIVHVLMLAYSHSCSLAQQMTSLNSHMFHVLCENVFHFTWFIPCLELTFKFTHLALS